MASEFNLLVLGQSGTGKSTWINSIANYLTYQTFDDALTANKPMCLIPSTFSLSDDNFEEVVVSFGSKDENERSLAGQSSTKSPKVYTFTCNANTINIIDVPGIGDTAGLETDDKHIREILDTVALFKELHAICIVIKSTETIISTEFSYCLNQLLMQLHKNAISNTVFVITNTRGADYKPGSTLRPLKAYLAELYKMKGINVPLTKDTMYCIDNEAFRFQCAYYQYRSFRDMDYTAYKKSWDESRNSTFRLVNYMKHLRPHNVIETISINEARAVIIMLIQPLAVITGLIQNNAANYEENFDEIVEQLQKNLAISEFDIKIEELSMPRTVCTEKKCVSVEKLSGTNQYITFYKQVCHETCFLENVPLKHFPEPKLASCWAMRGNETCRICSCHFTKHMHIDFNQRTIMKESAINKKIQKCSSKVTTEAAAVELENFVKELHNEQQVVTETMVKFGGFLGVNAILEYNTNVEERLNMEIRKAEAAADLSKSTKVVDRLTAVQKNYREQQRKLEATIKTANGICTITPEEVVELKAALFRLPLHGQKIEELYNVGRDKNTTNYGSKNFVKIAAKHMPL